MTLIRDEIETLVAERRELYRRQAEDTFAFATDLAEIRAGLDAKLRGLWEELRFARADRLRHGELSALEAWVLVARVPQMALA